VSKSRTRDIMLKEARTTNGASVGIPARLMSFPLPEGRPRFAFFGGNALASSAFSVFSAIFPPGERFFVDTVRRFRDQIEDETLRAQVSGFIGQEAIHGREHEHLNGWFQAQGYDIATADRMIRIGLGLLKYLPASQQLACTVFMEHWTATLAEQWLTHTEFRETSDPEILKLWTWHALEELEHRSVAADVHALISKHRYREHLLAVPLVLAALAPGILFSWGWIVAKHGEALNVRENRRGLRALFSKGGFITRTLERLPEYFPRDHHPSQMDTTDLERVWHEKLFGENGGLNSYFRNREAVQKALVTAPDRMAV
jgi:predicted metal-dependent hydrolase